jgi:hypothetical protein
MRREDYDNWMAAGPQEGETVESEAGELGIVLKASPNYLLVAFKDEIRPVCAHTHPVVGC